MSDKVVAWLQGKSKRPETFYIVCAMVNFVWHWQQNAKTGNVSEAESALCQLEKLINKIREES